MKVLCFKILALLCLVFFVFSLGLVVGIKQIPPFRTIYSFYTWLSQSDSNIISSSVGLLGKYQGFSKNPIVSNFDVNEVISLTTRVEVQNTRDNLINYIFKKRNGYITHLINQNNGSDNIRSNYKLFNSVSGSEVVELYKIDFNNNMYAYFARFTPASYNGCVFIFHQGHTGLLDLGGVDVIEKSLEKGCITYGIEMPFEGLNKDIGGAYFDERFGPIEFSGHNSLAILESDKFTPIELFVGATVAALDLEYSRHPETIYGMAGLSGGAWTTLLVSAFDTRIRFSFAVSGTMPIFLRGASGTWSDFEQHYAPLHRVANYLEQHILAASGDGRHNVLVTIPLDPTGLGGRHHEIYDQKLVDIVSALDGKFSSWIDSSTNKHKMSKQTIDRIF